jgi:hypothetical protein
MKRPLVGGFGGYLKLKRKYTCCVNKVVTKITENVCGDHQQWRILGGVENLVIDGCWVSVLSRSELLGVFARCSVVERTVDFVSSGNWCISEVDSGLLYALLCPLQVLLHFLCRSHAFGETGLCAHQSALGKLLEFEKFAVLGVEFARSADCQYRHFIEFER